MYSLISTVGIEFECEKISSGNLAKVLGGNFRLTHDASIETDASLRANGMFIFSTPNSSFIPTSNKVTMGTEIITVPFDTESKDLLSELKMLTSQLVQLGEPEKSLRAGIHIHINMSYNLNILKRILELGMYLEDVFFLLATQGYVFRGMKVNESAYCRPITSFGPQCVSTRHGTSQVFNAEDLLASTSTEDFWRRYGDTNVESAPQQRYTPQRYTWLNFYSLLAHGTVEFRTFNKTLSPFKIMAEVEFCQRFCEYAIRTGFSEQVERLPIHSVYDNRTREDIIETFEEFCKNISLSETSHKILLNILYNSPLVNLPQSYIWTHLERVRHGWWLEDSYKPRKISIDEVHEAQVIDIHTLRGERRPN